MTDSLIIDQRLSWNPRKIKFMGLLKFSSKAGEELVLENRCKKTRYFIIASHKLCCFNTSKTGNKLFLFLSSCRLLFKRCPFTAVSVPELLRGMAALSSAQRAGKVMVTTSAVLCHPETGTTTHTETERKAERNHMAWPLRRALHKQLSELLLCGGLNPDSFPSR